NQEAVAKRHLLYVSHAAKIADDAQITIQVRALTLWEERPQLIESILGGHDGRGRAAVGAKRRRLERAEEEQLVFLDRPAEREAILILNRDGTGCQAVVELLAASQREERAGRDDVIDRAMKSICPAPGNQVDDRASAASILRRIIRAEHRHLLKPV